MLNRIIYSVIFLALCWSAQGQDVHYSQFFNSPLNLSPGLTGVYDGNQRYHLNFKNQWNNPIGYNSFDVGADFKLDQCGTKRNHLNLGGLINYDQAGDLKLRATGINLLASFTLGLGENLDLTPGIQAGFVARNFGWENALWPTNNGIQTPDNIQNTSNSYFDLGAGLNLRYQTSFRNIFDIGAGLSHLNSPDVNFDANSTADVELVQKLNLYAMFQWPLANKFDLWLNGLYSNQTPYSEILLNAQGKIYLGDTYTKALYLGVGARLSDVEGDSSTGLESIYPIIGLQLGNFRGEFNYDINMGKFKHAAIGGPELSLMYTISCIPPTECKPCPIY